MAYSYSEISIKKLLGHGNKLSSNISTLNVLTVNNHFTIRHSEKKKLYFTNNTDIINCELLVYIYLSFTVNPGFPKMYAYHV